MRRVDDVSLDADGQAATVQVCSDCGHALSADSPKTVHMPKYALANDNWIGRMPFDLTPDGDLKSYYGDENMGAETEQQTGVEN